MSKSNSKVGLRLPLDIRKALQEVIDYSWADEKEHYEEWLLDVGNDENHIFKRLKQLRRWLKSPVVKDIPIYRHPTVMLVEALVHLNTHYGRGEITAIDFEIQLVTVAKQSGLEYVKYRDKAGFIYFRGHKKKYL